MASMEDSGVFYEASQRVGLLLSHVVFFFCSKGKAIVL